MPSSAPAQTRLLAFEFKMCASGRLTAAPKFWMLRTAPDLDPLLSCTPSTLSKENVLPPLSRRSEPACSAPLDDPSRSLLRTPACTWEAFLGALLLPSIHALLCLQPHSEGVDRCPHTSPAWHKSILVPWPGIAIACLTNLCVYRRSTQPPLSAMLCGRICMFSRPVFLKKGHTLSSLSSSLHCSGCHSSPSSELVSA